MALMDRKPGTSPEEFARAMIRLMELLKAEVGDIPPGHERNKKCVNVAEYYLARAKSDAERDFFTTLLSEFKRDLEKSAALEAAARQRKVTGEP